MSRTKKRGGARETRVPELFGEEVVRERGGGGEDSNGNNEGGSDKLQWLLSEEAKACVSYFLFFQGCGGDGHVR